MELAVKSTKEFDFFRWTAKSAMRRFRDLPEPLPWVEPSINMPYLQACASYVLGQDLGCILLIAVLLEHTLRLAVIDRKAGHQGALDEKLWAKYSGYSIKRFFKKEAETVGTVIKDEDAEWWKNFAARIVRNKTAHLDVPVFIEKLASQEEYMGIYATRAERELIYSTRFWWGRVFHRADAIIAIRFLREASEKLRGIIAKMDWQPDRTHWASQEWEYNSFFHYPWQVESMRASLQKS